MSSTNFLLSMLEKLSNYVYPSYHDRKGYIFQFFNKRQSVLKTGPKSMYHALRTNGKFRAFLSGFLFLVTTTKNWSRDQNLVTMTIPIVMATNFWSP